MLTIEPTTTQLQQELFIRLYQSAFPAAASFIRKMGGNFDDAKDIFQDALLVYYEKTREQEFDSDHNENAYLVGICKHLWYKRHREQKAGVPLDENLNLTEEEEPKVSNALMRLVERSGKKCLDVLKAFYYDKLNMKTLSQTFGFSGERSATVQKHKCLEKVRNEIQQRSLSKEDFYE
ncbi:MAG: sigma-70 family RNA polymerase sigma factor [Bacteroidia bacterium]|nr:sigma-70 family RNA polymerase sigma factor [Bacteroidia bacterium]